MIRLSFILFIIGSILTACDTSTTHHASDHDTNGAGTKYEAITKSLDLKVTQEMIERLGADQALVNQADMKTGTPQAIQLDKRKPESRLAISGEVFYDETSEDYLEAIDGGKINLKIKFN